MPWLGMDGKTYTERLVESFATEKAARNKAIQLGGVLQSERLSGSRYQAASGQCLRIEYDPMFNMYSLYAVVEVNK